MSQDLETRVKETGLRLYRLIEGEAPSIFKKEFWTGKVMEWCMQNEAFKVEMFRFVDVFPYLGRAESVARHMQEYFCRPGQDFPSALQWGLKMVSPGSLIARGIAKQVTANITGMGKTFIAGETPEEALPVLEKFRAQGLAATVDLLGEAVISEGEAEDYQRRYLDVLAALDTAQTRWTALGGGAGGLDWGFAPRVNVSIKPSAMYSQMNARAFEHSLGAARERLRPVFRRGMAVGASMLLDMEHTGLKNLTLALYTSLMEEPEFRDYPHTGLVIQAYLRESGEDLRRLIEWAKKRRVRFNLRLVKGAYWDAEAILARQNEWPVPVYEQKWETDANYEAQARVCLENHDLVTLACASHNIRTIAYVTELAQDLKVPADRLEYQILYGMAEPVRTALVKAGLPLRLYVPVGEMIPGMAYLVRRLLENTSNESFLSQSFAKGVPREHLLRNPVDVGRDHPAPAPEEPPPGPGGLPAFRNEPIVDWTIASERERFAKALKDVRGRFPIEAPLLIGGKKAKTPERIVSTNPNRPDEVVGRAASAGADDARRAVEAAREAFPAWRDLDPRARAGYLVKAAAAARLQRRELAALQVYEVGKAWAEADADICEAIDFLEYYGRKIIRLGTPRRMGHAPGEASHLFYEPRGVAAVIAPWNFPFAISAGMTSAALVTGNTVVYKPASQSTVTGSMLSKIFEEARLPAGVLNFLPGPGDALGEVLVTHPDVALIAFTGSRDVGLDILRKAHTPRPGDRFVKQVIAEMGGKNAIILDSDADLDEAVTHVLQSAFGYQGQKCSACSRLIVLEENYEKVVSRLKSAAESLILGPVEDPASFMGAVIGRGAQEKILAAIEAGKAVATLFLSRPVPGEGHTVPLTIFTDVPPDSALAQEEIFGPVLAVIRAADMDAALRIANGTAYALTGGLFSRSPANIARARREFRVGNLYINRGCTGAIVERHPFGGFKMSGIGSKSGGPDYLLQFMVPRNTVENTLRRGFAPPEEREE